MKPDSEFSKFSENARRVLSIAQGEAESRQQPYIGSEHILLGLIRVTQGFAAKILKRIDVDFDKIVDALEVIVPAQSEDGDTATPPPPPDDVADTISLTPRTKYILRRAARESNRMQSNYIGTEHLLIAVMRDVEDDASLGTSVAGNVLSSLGVQLKDIMSELENLSGEDDRVASGPVRGEPSRSAGKSSRSSASNTPTLDKYGTDLTAQAAAGELDKVIGRESEIQRLIHIVSRRSKNNPILIGEPGVGKTAIVEKLATMIHEGEVPDFLMDKKVISFEMGALVAGTKYRGEFEDRLRKIINELRSSKNCLVFIDEIHTVIGAGSAEGSVDAANILKPALARGNLQVIGATTVKDYRKYIERDAAFERRFQQIIVDEPNYDQMVEIMHGVKEAYENHHTVEITDEALEAAVKLSERYIHERNMPDKAVDLLDEAATAVRIHNTISPSELRELRAAERKLEEIKRMKESTISKQNYKEAADLRDRELNQLAEIEKINTELDEGRSKVTPTVEREDIAKAVALWTKVPIERITGDTSNNLAELEASLKRDIVGQPEAIKEITRGVRRGHSAFKDHRRPAGTFLFLGPTGVGKTYLVKKLAQHMFGSETSMIRLDMSEFMERHSVSRLIGAPPSYVGYEEGGQLTEAVRAKPYSIILLDEIEKAHPDVFNIFLQVLEDGRLTDGKGRVVNFKNTIIVMTSNLGSQHLQNSTSFGFESMNANAAQQHERAKELVMETLKSPESGFRPEFINRLDATLVFNPLSEKDAISIVEILVKEIDTRAKDQHGFNVEADEHVHAYLADKGFDAKMGARPLRRLIETEIEDVLSKKMYKPGIKVGGKVNLTMKKGEIDFKIKSPDDSTPKLTAGKPARGELTKPARGELTKGKKSPPPKRTSRKKSAPKLPSGSAAD